MSKKTTWIHDVPAAHFLNPACWTNGVPGDGDDVVVPPHPDGLGFEWPPRGHWPKAPLTLHSLTMNVTRLARLTLPAFDSGIVLTKPGDKAQ